MCDGGEEVVIILKTAALSGGSEAAVVDLEMIRCQKPYYLQDEQFRTCGIPRSRT